MTGEDKEEFLKLIRETGADPSYHWENLLKLEEFLNRLEANAFKLGCELTKKSLCCLVCEEGK